MFKNLIKKVREESHNASILPETNADETHEQLTKDQSESDDNVRSSSTSNRKSEFENEQTGRLVSDLFSEHIDCSVAVINADNWLDVLKCWIHSKDVLLQQQDKTIENCQHDSKELDTEIHQLKAKLFDLKNSTENIPHSANFLQRKVDLLDAENESLRSTIKDLRAQLNEVESERDDLLIKSTETMHSKVSEDEHQKQRREIERLRELIVERDKIIEEQDKRLLVDRETQGTQTISLEENAVVEIFAEPNIDPIRKLQAELDDKNRTIKILQQRYNDLRKTLQREFNASIPKELNQIGTTNTLPLVHNESSASSQSDVDGSMKRSNNQRQMTAAKKNVSFMSTTNESGATAAILPHTIVESTQNRNQKLGQRNSIDGQQYLNATNFKYLKHVLLKFMTSTEEEAIHLIRAVSTLLNFSSDEERLVRETLDYKMSWFGKVSRLKALSSNGNY